MSRLELKVVEAGRVRLQMFLWESTQRGQNCLGVPETSVPVFCFCNFGVCFSDVHENILATDLRSMIGSWTLLNEIPLRLGNRYYELRQKMFSVLLLGNQKIITGLYHT